MIDESMLNEAVSRGYTASAETEADARRAAVSTYLVLEAAASGAEPEALDSKILSRASATALAEYPGMDWVSQTVRLCIAVRDEKRSQRGDPLAPRNSATLQQAHS